MRGQIKQLRYQMENFNCDICVRAIINKVVNEEHEMSHDIYKVKDSSLYQNVLYNNTAGGFASKYNGVQSENGVFNSACFSNCRRNGPIMQGTSHDENSVCYGISFPKHTENDNHIMGCESDITKSNVSAIACSPEMVTMLENKDNQTEMDNKKDTTRAKTLNGQCPTVPRITEAPMTTNVKVKLFCCDECSKSYSRKDHLNRHKLIHKGDRPHICMTCFKSFIRKDKLKRHEKIHQKKEQPELVQNYDCPTCGKVFIRKDSCKKHYMCAHKGDK